MYLHKENNCRKNDTVFRMWAKNAPFERSTTPIFRSRMLDVSFARSKASFKERDSGAFEISSSIARARDGSLKRSNGIRMPAIRAKEDSFPMASLLLVEHYLFSNTV